MVQMRTETDFTEHRARRGRFSLRLRVVELGGDILLVLTSDCSEHAGTVVLAQPRPSHTGKGMSATSSVLNVEGHMDEGAARPLAEAVCKRTGRRVVCVCGIHIENATERDIEDVLSLARSMASKVF